MTHQVITVSGWKSRKLTTVSMYRYRACGHCQEMICGGGDGKYRCFHCDKKFAEQKFGEAKRKRTVVVCANCGREVTLLPSTFGVAGLGFICSDCSNYVAVLYGTHFVNPSTVLTVDWNPTVCRRGEPIPSGLSFIVCKTMKDFLALKVLQAIVKEEDSRFLFGPPERTASWPLTGFREEEILGFSGLDGGRLRSTSSDVHRRG